MALSTPPQEDNQTAKKEPSVPQTYEDLLPASYRTLHDDVAVPTLTVDYLYGELEVKRLNDIHQWLWTV